MEIDTYEVLENSGFHREMENAELDSRYASVGGVPTKATLEGDIDWEGQQVQITDEVRLPTKRDNGTVRDLDLLIPTTDPREIQLAKEIAMDCVGGDLVVSTFGLKSYQSGRLGVFDFTGSRYIDIDGTLYWHLGGVETEIPQETLNPWRIISASGDTVIQSLGPVSLYGAYLCRSITGVRPKDKEKVERLEKIIMPQGNIKSLPADYREELLAFMSQADKVRIAREKLSWFGVKAALLGSLEKHPEMVQLAQGVLDGPLSGFVGKR